MGGDWLTDVLDDSILAVQIGINIGWVVRSFALWVIQVKWRDILD